VLHDPAAAVRPKLTIDIHAGPDRIQTRSAAPKSFHRVTQKVTVGWENRLAQLNLRLVDLLVRI
jgi:hypothetical protein